MTQQEKPERETKGRTLYLHPNVWAWVDEQVTIEGHESFSEWLQHKFLQKTTRYIFVDSSRGYHQSFKSLDELKHHALEQLEYGESNWIIYEEVDGNMHDTLDIRVEAREIYLIHPETEERRRIGRIDSLL